MPRPCCLAVLGSHVPPLQPTPLPFFGAPAPNSPTTAPGISPRRLYQAAPLPDILPGPRLRENTPTPPACLPSAQPPLFLTPLTSVPSHTLFPYWELSSSSPLPLAHAFGCPLLWKLSLTPRAGHVLPPCLPCSALLTPTLNLRFLAAALAGPTGGRKLCLTCFT